MNKEEYFFNTYLGRELNVCGDLIYKGFEALENNQQNILNNDYLYQELGIKDSVDFLQEAPAFIFWINNSIAFERLGKIIVLFLMWNENQQAGTHKQIFDEIFHKTNSVQESASNQEKELLRTHNNNEIYKSINKFGYNLELDKEEKHLLQLFTEFYSNLRYGRFHDQKTYEFNQDVIMLKALFKKFYKVHKKNIYMCHSMDETALFHIGKAINSMAKKYYESIKELSGQHGLFTSELHDDSFASRVFLNLDESVHELFIWNRIVRNEVTYLFMYDKLRKNYPDAPKPLEADEMGLEFSDNALLKQGYSSIMVDSVREILYERLFEDENSDDKKVCLNKRECDIEGLISSEDHYKDY
ncbi:MAG: hypothetical protein MR804_07915 [Limosilactobacillus reuteri]|uniref:hypothetical protein n=1 Tax=Limosilactobacillus reuteri TaxID=1598 RepID=UPI001E41B3FB|nr:hypothetical protein [Limosilactobacillus reuteri]MCC4515915.1 hypothetical protein [Limosilactobacillus reuteri]MCI6368808.1 hypothetical protein [Limosilactobacillus reuteri]MDY4729613.1 hypothetical protein [Lactobacillus amylovorus]